MATSRTFKTTIVREGSMCFIPIPASLDVKAVFGKARPPVVVTLNGYSFRSTVSVYGGDSVLPLRKSNREAAKLDGTETLDVTLTLDTKARTVEVPGDLAKALARSKRVKAAWDKLSYSHQREHVDAINDAKKPETRARRVAKCLEMLKA